MPDKRTHRGPHPDDVNLFAEKRWPRLRQAVTDLSWLLSHGYADRSSLKIVGDRFNLTQRQRIAVMRSACADDALARRTAHMMNPEKAAGQRIHIDGYNLITTIEAALSGGVLIRGRDGCVRDMASMHGSYRKVEETLPALRLIVAITKLLKVGACVWYLDQPVSNSGRLKTIIRQIADENECDWEIEIVPNPDRVLVDLEDPIVTSDSIILNHCAQWLNLAPIVIERNCDDPWLIEF